MLESELLILYNVLQPWDTTELWEADLNTTGDNVVKDSAKKVINYSSYYTHSNCLTFNSLFVNNIL